MFQLSFRGVRAFLRARTRNPEMEGMMKSYYVYILASRPAGAIYVGITSDLVKRVFEHRSKAVPSFTSRYNITQLVWFEVYDDPLNAIAREKQLKKWRRAWKVALIERDNPEWRDL
jgi:putative endonuclease